MCSSRCAMPCSSSRSLRAPDLTHTPRATLSTCGRVSVATVKPLDRRLTSTPIYFSLHGTRQNRTRTLQYVFFHHFQSRGKHRETLLSSHQVRQSHWSLRCNATCSLRSEERRVG